MRTSLFLYIIILLISSIHHSHSKSYVISSQDSFQFHATPFQKINMLPLKKFCALPKLKAKLYLKNKYEVSEFDPLIAYQYGTLIGFAPCIKNNLNLAVKYLKIASENDVAEASFLLGLISLKKHDFINARYFFMKASSSFHSEANYNYALLESYNFKKISQKTVDALDNAASSGDLKSRHDNIVMKLKLFLNGHINLRKTEILHYSNILNKISKSSDNVPLKKIAEENLNLLIKLQPKSISSKENNQVSLLDLNMEKKYNHKKNFNNSKDNHNPIENEKNHTIDFSSFEKQGIDTFNEYLMFSDNHPR